MNLELKHSIVLLVLVFFFGLLFHYSVKNKTVVAPENAFELVVLSDGQEQKIKPWRQDEGHICIFLPSYASLDGARVELHTAKRIRIAGTVLSDGMTLAAFSPDQEYDLVVGRESAVKIQFIRSAEIAAMFIQAESGSLDSVHADKNYKEKVTISLYTSDGKVNYQTVHKDKIRGRGNSTWKYEKKPYNLYLDHPADLLQLDAAKHWVLLANAIEETNLRNWLIYIFADRFGKCAGFAPGCEFVDLFINGEYRGLYLLCEKTEIAENRLEVSNDTVLFDLNTASRMDDLDSPFELNPGQAVEIKNPDPCSEEQQEALKTRLLQMQAAFMAENWENITNYIDLDSWARKYLIEEVFQNYDAGYRSQYFFWNGEDNRIYAGPCWDYDNTLGSCSWMSPRNFLALRKWVTWQTYTPWFAALWEQEEFREYVKSIYQEEFLPQLSDLLENDFPGKASQISQAAEADRMRWPDLCWYYECYADAVSSMLDFLKSRIDFLSSAWINGTEYCTVTVKIYPATWRYLYYSVLPGTRCEDLDLLNTEEYWTNGIPTLMDERTGEPFDPDSLIWEDTVLNVEYSTD